MLPCPTHLQKHLLHKAFALHIFCSLWHTQPLVNVGAFVTTADSSQLAACNLGTLTQQPTHLELTPDLRGCQRALCTFQYAKDCGLRSLPLLACAPNHWRRSFFHRLPVSIKSMYREHFKHYLFASGAANLQARTCSPVDCGGLSWNPQEQADVDTGRHACPYSRYR